MFTGSCEPPDVGVGDQFPSSGRSEPFLRPRNFFFLTQTLPIICTVFNFFFFASHIFGTFLWFFLFVIKAPGLFQIIHYFLLNVLSWFAESGHVAHTSLLLWTSKLLELSSKDSCWIGGSL